MQPLPTLLAVLAFVPLGALVWWALVGPRPDPSPLDRSEIGFEVREADGGAPVLPLVHDLEWVRTRMLGWQGELGGRLGPPLPLREGRYAAVVYNGEGSPLMPLPDLAGVVEWTAGDDTARRCAFSDPVPLDRLQARLAEDDPDIELEATAVTGRCTDDGPLVAVPAVRRHIVSLSVLQRLAGQRADSALVPEGALLVEPDGSVSRRRELGADVGLPVYPWEVAREALLHAAPDNPAAGIGSWADPVYPLPVALQDRVWWVMPLAPLDGAVKISGYLVVAADELRGGTLNPVTRHWLDAPQVGPSVIEDRIVELLDRLGDDDQPAVRPTLPSGEGAWHGHVSTAEEPLRYVIDASADGEACLLDPAGAPVSCRQAGEVSRR